MTFAIGEKSIADINLLSQFLAYPEVHDLSACEPVDSIVICASAVLHQAEVLFRVLEKRPELTKTLVLCGGKGHSTPLIYEAVAKNSTYHLLAKEVEGLPEARVLEKILYHYFDIPAITSAGTKILIEDKSTNSAANAVESRKVLEDAGMTTPKSLILIQDPTMQIRTVASFKKVYSDPNTAPKIISCPIFVPKMHIGASGPVYDIPGVGEDELWAHSRFFGLILGEIPRLRLYGPEGKGSITHVDVPVEADEALKRLQPVLESKR
jgi:hypothetical protein